MLVHGAVGGVGQFATQLAHRRGAHVIATASPDAFDAARALGADEVVDGRKELDETVGRVDLVFDTVGGDLLERASALLGSGGRLVSIAEEPRGEGTYFVVEPNREQLIEVAHLADNGELRVAIDSTFAPRRRPRRSSAASPRASTARLSSALPATARPVTEGGVSQEQKQARRPFCRHLTEATAGARKREAQDPAKEEER